jgi:hypothetical protein
MTDHPARPGTRRVGVLVHDKLKPLDAFGFFEAFSIARNRPAGRR